MAKLNSAHLRSQAKCQLVQTRYIERVKMFSVFSPYIINILLTKLSRSVCENLDLGISQSDQARVTLAGNESHIRIRDNKNDISLFKLEVCV